MNTHCEYMIGNKHVDQRRKTIAIPSCPGFHSIREEQWRCALYGRGLIVALDLRDLRRTAIGIRAYDEGVASLLHVGLATDLHDGAARLRHRYRRAPSVSKTMVEPVEVTPKPPLSWVARKLAEPGQIVDRLGPNIRMSKHLGLRCQSDGQNECYCNCIRSQKVRDEEHVSGVRRRKIVQENASTTLVS